MNSIQIQPRPSLTHRVVAHIISRMMTTLPARRAIVGMLLSLLLLAMASGARASGEPDGAAPLTAEYPVPGSPYQVAVEAPNRVWATLPDENAIVRLIVTSPGLYDVDVASFELPVAGSEPYDIAFAAGRVWVTERSGNRIGCFDAVTSTWTEYAVPTADSQPTGIVVVPGNPTEVWFAERMGNKLGRLRVSNTDSYPIEEYELPTANAYPESVAAIASEPVWLSAPGVSLIYSFRPSRWSWSPEDAFEPMFTGNGSRPWDIEVGADGVPWFTEPHGNRVGKYTFGTLAYFTWFELPVSSSTPYGLEIAQGTTWFTEKDGNRVGQLQPVKGILREFALPGVAPTGIAVDATGCSWIAASSQDKIIRWCSPYFQFAYLPLVRRDK